MCVKLQNAPAHRLNEAKAGGRKKISVIESEVAASKRGCRGKES
jgi:hypothetical protein